MKLFKTVSTDYGKVEFYKKGSGIRLVAHYNKKDGDRDTLNVYSDASCFCEKDSMDVLERAVRRYQ